VLMPVNVELTVSEMPFSLGDTLISLEGLGAA
jgi:hypothetical protein